MLPSWTSDQLRNRSVTGTLSNKCRSLRRTMPKPKLTPKKVPSLKDSARFCITSIAAYYSKLHNAHACWQLLFGPSHLLDSFALVGSLTFYVLKFIKKSMQCMQAQRWLAKQIPAHKTTCAVLKIHCREEIEAKMVIASFYCNGKPNFCLGCQMWWYFVGIICRWWVCYSAVLLKILLQKWHFKSILLKWQENSTGKWQL